MDTLVNLGRGLLGIAAFLGIAYAFSSNRRAIDWKLVATGLLLQAVIAITVLKVPLVRQAFDLVGVFFVNVIAFTTEGTRLVFGWMVQLPNTPEWAFSKSAPAFAVAILPTIIFFSALTSLLYYLGVLQKIVYGFAWIMSKTMKLSGAESLSASANIFVGQTEAPLLIKPYIASMTRSEMLAIMIGGMATIAGGVMVVYITLLGGDNAAEQVKFATHLLTKSIISAPCALVIAKMLLPETEPINQNLTLSRDRFGANLLDAICLGTTDGIKLAVNVGGMLIVFTAVIAMVNSGLGDVIGRHTGLNDWIAAVTDGRYTSLSLQFVFGIAGAPLAWLMGVEPGNLMVAGQLLGEKTVLNEFVAYFSMNKLQAAGVLTDDRTRIILTYALCGFSNIVSIGIQIGGIGALAPNQRESLALLGWRALLGGSLACFIPACFAAILA